MTHSLALCNNFGVMLHSLDINDTIMTYKYHIVYLDSSTIVASIHTFIYQDFINQIDITLLSQEES